MKLKQQVAALALCSALVAACDNETAKGGGVVTSAPTGSDVRDGGVPGAASGSTHAPMSSVSANSSAKPVNSSGTNPQPGASASSSVGSNPPVTTTSSPSAPAPNGTAPSPLTGIVKLKLKVK